MLFNIYCTSFALFTAPLLVLFVHTIPLLYKKVILTKICSDLSRFSIIIIIIFIIIVTLQTVWGMSAWVNWGGGMNLEVQMTVWGTNSTEGAAHVIVKL